MAKAEWKKAKDDQSLAFFIALLVKLMAFYL